MASLAAKASSEGFKPLTRGASSSSFRGALPSARDSAAELGGSSAEHFLKEQVLRGPAESLPPRLGASERADAASGALYYSLKERIPADLAATPGAGGQALRRVMLHGATIVFVTPGYRGKRFIYERAKELGVRSIVIDAPGSWAEEMARDGTIVKFVPLDLDRPSKEVLADCIDLVKGFKETGEMPAGVCTFCELSVPLVARLAEHLGLPGPSSAAVDTARDKHLTRAAMAKAGLPSPACKRVESAGDLAAAAAVVGFPAVLKPLNGAASLGVKKVLSQADLEQCYADVLAEMRDTVVSSGALVKKDPNSPGASDEKIAFLMEEYLDGPEVDVDVVMARGEAAYARVVDNGPTAEPYFAETWGVCPSLLKPADQTVLRDLSVAALKCCGFDVGVFHVECKLTARGPRLIEINARMGGGQVRSTHLLCSGVDLVEETLFTCVGIPCNPHVAVEGKAVAYTYVTSPTSGRVAGLAAAAARAAAEDARVVYCKPLVAEGAAVVGSDDALPDWLLDVMTTAATPAAALDHV
eukprot:CAMPEP_0119288328 /NCGR_PEP_ID=MMETSP1329-20130426/37064_1 /TAXON_ID=114041 /ORGANISM="Genus nov. species nov., Strain RCC1024" /LENGTH=527 /DNA_ID=CAMNT_0007289109 /DNA_START=89 /DNA_END=1668 /DNA_ORIENTATION=-